MTWDWTMASTKSESSLVGSGKDTLEPSTPGKGQEAPSSDSLALSCIELTGSEVIFLYFMRFYCLVN